MKLAHLMARQKSAGASISRDLRSRGNTVHDLSLDQHIELCDQLQSCTLKRRIVRVLSLTREDCDGQMESIRMRVKR